MKSWIPNDTVFLEPRGWVLQGRDIVGGYTSKGGHWYHNYKRSTDVWAPPPAGANIALEELRKAR